MPLDYLHNHPEFPELIRIVAEEKGIAPALVEKDYWIMHCLHGLQSMNLTFELKGGTSLSKGYRIIDRFSEDIDIRIEPPEGHDVKVGHNQTSAAQIKTRRDFYDWLAATIKIDGIAEVERDTAFDNPDLFSGGIRLSYDSTSDPIEGLREGVLLELGFDDVTPNQSKDISSWAYDHAAAQGVEMIDNRAKAVPCYDPGYTFVEKLQTISTKFRKQQESGSNPIEMMRHYYDVYGLLKRPEVQEFIGTEAYKAHKKKRFPKADNQNIAQNEAFLLSDAKTRALYAKAYQDSAALYYASKPTFEAILKAIAEKVAEL
jgi:Nucleotidyl transferase AbiEii toxin, Type IV TA system